MKKLLFILLAFSCSMAWGQNVKYSEITEIKYKGHTYACDKEEDTGFIYLYRKEYHKPNHAPNLPNVFTDTGKEYVEYTKPLLKEETKTKPRCFNIVYEAFKRVDLSKLNGHRLGITIYIDSHEGSVYRVEFLFGDIELYNEIDISVYARIESEIMKKVKFKTTDEGKRLNYISMMWVQDPSKKPQFE